MNCSACRHENPVGSAFCEECGAALERRCPSCGTACGPAAKFCRSCGGSLVARPAETADEAVARKIVTIVFADLIGSTSLHERLDAESVRRFMDRYYGAMRTAVEAHGGTVTQLLGDGVKAVFGAPRVAEDDAIRAVRAAVGMQHAFRELAREQLDVVGQTGLRVAVNTGEVVASDTMEVIGDPVNVAARLQEQARDGDVVIGESTRRLVGELVTLAPLGTFTLKGRSETVAAYRVVSLDRPADVAATAFVGRDDELRRLTAVYDALVYARRARLAVILGSPGLGKSRLIAEFVRRLGPRATVLTARCDPTGGATFAPLAEALRTLLRLDDGASGDGLAVAIDALVSGDEAERARIAGGITSLLAGTPAPPEETFFVVRRLLAALATAQPVVLAIDDLQWAEPLLLDLTEHLVQWSTDAPLMVLVAARPELRDSRSALAAPGGLVADVVTLAGLEAGAATRLAANVIGADELPAAVAGRVLATSEGNPLFVGELVRMLVHDGALKREGDRWIAGVEVATLEMPPTIQALLAARIERLRPEERTVLERAAVVGRQFSRAAVAHLLPGDARNLDARLEALRRSELIEPDVGWYLGEPALRFHHVLIRDAAYRRLLKGTRAELHARFGQWIESRVGEAVEHDETIGWHLEQAHQNLRELGPVDAQGRALGERAARYLAEAGRRALARDDLPLAASLLGRALDRLDARDSARADLALDWCEALLAAGDVGPAAAAIEELGRFAGESERLRAWHACFAGERAALTDPQALRTTADAVTAAAGALAAAGDAAGEAKAHSVHALALARLGQVGACEAALDRALAAARRARDRRRSNAVLAAAPLAALWGPSPVTRASGRCLDVVRVLRITQGSPAVEAVALRCQGVLEALRGRTEAARRMIASSRRLVEELGITQRLLEADVFAGLVELLEGDAAAAERCLRPAYDGLRSHGLRIDAARAGALLGRALLALGRAAEAEDLSHESEALAGDDLKAAIAWRGVRAEALARRGEHGTAVDFARAAVELAAATDAPLDHADARLALAAALRAVGRSDEAAAEETRAIELWEAKGATLLAERARRAGVHAIHADRAPDDRGAPVHPVHRRVRANAATGSTARVDAALAARDAGALPALLAESVEIMDHSTGTTYGRQGMLTTWRSLLSAHPRHRFELLATLGDSLSLSRLSTSARGFAGAKFDVGAYDREEISLVEVDEEGRWRWAEIFAADRLGDAVARLYERYAEVFPDGPARVRAAATARMVASVLALDPDRFAAEVSPSVEFVDTRTVGFGSVHGADAVLRAIRALFELTQDPAVRVDDIFGLRPDALLMRWTMFGTERAGGGAFERTVLLLLVFGPDGLLTQMVQLEADREEEALARFDELTAEAASRIAAAPAAKQRERRARPNAATMNAARVDAAIVRRDADALAGLLADELEVADHKTGVAFDRQGVLSSFRSLLNAEDPTCVHEPLATLGDALALCRHSMSASRFAGRKFDVGPFEIGQLTLIEVDLQGRRRRTEIFALNRLGDAISRLYECYADLLPEGPAGVRVTATARSVAAMQGPLDLERYAAAFAPGIEAIDHRILGTWSARGAEALLAHFRSALEVADEVVTRDEEVLGLRSDALLVRRTHSGTARAGGGAYERPYIVLEVFGSDGRLTRIEFFDADREDDALARFGELVTEPPAARIAPSGTAKRRERRVRPNAATAHAARVDAAVAARDADAFGTILADEAEVVDHTNGVTFDRRGLLATWRGLVNARDPMCRHEPLATLGNSLAVCRLSLSASAFAGANFDVGAYEKEEIHLIEADAHARRRRSETFAVERLGGAVARLYQQYAELLPGGPARTRAAATARSVTAMADIERFAARFAPAVESVDHRTLGTWSARGVGRLRQELQALVEVADDIVLRDDDVLALEPDAFLVRRTHLGTARAGGGAYERQYLMLSVFDAAGLLARVEWFEPDAEDEALVRFDELRPKPTAMAMAPTTSRVVEKRKRRVSANAATAFAARADAAVAARDGTALPIMFADDLEIVDRGTATMWDRQGLLASFRSLLTARDPMCRHEPVATLGDSLALSRISLSGSGFAGTKFDVGAYEMEQLNLNEVNARGQLRRSEVFATNVLGDGIARLYERYAELLPEGPARARAAATAHSVAVMLGPFDLARYATALPPDHELVDHRTLGVGSIGGAGAVLDWLRSLGEVAADLTFRIDDVLGQRSDALLVRWTTSGTDRAGGGAFENQFLFLMVFGTDGLLTRSEWFDSDREDEALARFDEVTAEPALGSRAVETRQRRVRPNAAVANAARFDAAIAARDITAVAAALGDESEVVDHTTGVTFDRQGALTSYRSLLSARDPAHRTETLATLGDSLAMGRISMSASKFTGRKFDVAAYEIEQLYLHDVDAEGRRRRAEVFASGQLGDAVARLYERHAELLPDGPARARAVATARSVAALLGPFDLDRYASALAPAVESVDHRSLGTWSARGAQAFLRHFRSLLDVADDVAMRDADVLAVRPDALLARRTHVGIDRAGGGAYERQFLVLWVFASDGLAIRSELFDYDREDEALARFDDLAAEPTDPLRIPPNAATRTGDRLWEYIERRDWDALRALCAPIVFEDRRRLVRTTGDCDMFVASCRLMSRAGVRRSCTPLATRGDRLVLQRVLWTGTSDGQVFEVETLEISEVDAEGRVLASISFDPDDRHAASLELLARYARSETSRRAPPAVLEVGRALIEHDLDRIRAVLPRDFVFHDHRRTGIGRIEGLGDYVAWIATLFELSPDALIEPMYDVATAKHAVLAVAHTIGTLVEGGAFESIFAQLVHFRDDRLVGVELFEIEDLDAARARFEELGAQDAHSH